MRRAPACSLAVPFLLPAPAAADRVTASPQVSARLGDRISDTAWGVIVDWSINCGSGRDRARVDRRDRVLGCERVARG